jgi:hypothetical protein
MEPILLVIAGLVVLATFAPTLPVLHRLPRIGAPRVHVHLSFEPDQDGSEDLEVVHVEGRAAGPRVLRVGFVNDGPKRVQATLVNVLVDPPVKINASDHLGDTSLTHGRAMPQAGINGRPMNFWADKDVSLTVGATLLDYLLTLPSDVRELGDGFVVRVQYDADDLYGGERIYEQRIPVVDVSGGIVVDG